MLLLFSTSLIQLQDCVNNVDFFEKPRHCKRYVVAFRPLSKDRINTFCLFSDYIHMIHKLYV